ncbi:hypothetical protein DB354_09460 [Opitutus sp. ER46]|nr:hypothetical protein DB354_09460 [Opitutus sp. ER46]
MHRAEQWRALATAMGWDLPRFASESHGVRSGRRIVIHTGAGHPVRRWPIERYHALAARLRAEGWEPSLVDDTVSDLDTLVDVLSTADRFIGNDSGPGHLAALLDVPTFTIFGPQRPELFAPQHPDAAWIEGAPCEYKPCFDACRFAQPDCLLSLSVDSVWSRVQAWLARQPRT